jgi:hypothetical protein
MEMIQKCNKLKADGDVKWCINFLLNTFHCRMFEVKKGQIYFLFDHYKHLNWRRASLRARIGATKLKDGYYYQTELVH